MSPSPFPDPGTVAPALPALRVPPLFPILGPLRAAPRAAVHVKKRLDVRSVVKDSRERSTGSASPTSEEWTSNQTKFEDWEAAAARVSGA